MLVLWIIGIVVGVLFIIKAERVADIWRSTEFSVNTENGKRRSQLMRRSGFWKFIGIVVVVVSAFLLSGGDRLFVSKSTEVILQSTPKENDAIK